MIVNIEKAEEIVNYTHQKKHAGMQKKLLHQVIQHVEQRRNDISEYLLTVDIISYQFQQKKYALEQLIHQLDDRGQSLDQGLVKISRQQKELERRQLRIQHDLQCMRSTAEQYREKKTKCQHQYSSVAAVPILSAQSKKRYIKARDRYSDAEQQVSETRQALEKCREHLKLVSKTVSAQNSEQDQLSNQRRGSIDTIQSSTQQLAYLKQGCDFWSGFDSYQAQVVLESALYLADEHTKKEGDLDMDQVWQKTFQLACFEYGEREIYGDTRWNMNSLEINFDCDLCQTSQTGWPRVINQHELACELCYSTFVDKICTQPIMDHPKADQPLQKLIPPSVTAGSKMRKIFHTLFHYHHPKINPL